MVLRKHWTNDGVAVRKESRTWDSGSPLSCVKDLPLIPLNFALTQVQPPVRLQVRAV